MTLHLIDFHRFAVYEAGVALISVLAYPGDSEEEIRAGVHASLCHHALRIRCEFEPNWALCPQPMKPIYALRTSREVDRDLRTLQRRLRDRMAAGRMAIGFLRVTSEPVSEMGFSGAGELRLDSRTFMDDAGSVRAPFRARISRNFGFVPRLTSPAISALGY